MNRNNRAVLREPTWNSCWGFTGNPVSLDLKDAPTTILKPHNESKWRGSERGRQSISQAGKITVVHWAMLLPDDWLRVVAHSHAVPFAIQVDKFGIGEVFCQIE